MGATGIFDFVGNMVNMGVGIHQNKLARDFADEQRHKKQKFDIEQRDYMNWYNSPEEQMKRFKEAGLNPNLIYGKGTPGNQSNMVQGNKAEGKFGLPKINAPNVLMELQQFQNLKKLKAQTDLTSEVANGQKIKNEVLSGTASSNIQRQIELTKQAIYNTNSAKEKAQLNKKLNQLKTEEIKIARKKADWMENGLSEHDNLIFRQLHQYFGDSIGGLMEKLNNISIDTSNPFKQ